MIINRNFAMRIFFSFFLLMFFSTWIQAQQTPQKKRKSDSGLITAEQIIKQTQPEALLSLPETSSEMSQTVQADRSSQIENQRKAELDESKQISRLRRMIEELSSRLDLLESSRKDELTEKQRKLLLNLEILSKAEERAESLRQKLFDLTERESVIRARLNQIELESTDEAINRSVALIGGLRPEVLREQRRKSLESERNNLLNLLSQIENHKLKLQESLTKADALAEKLRSRLEAQIEEALQEGNF